MSHIPNSAMPHAAPSQDSQNSQDQQTGGGFSLSESAGRVAELVRENPKTAAAAGAAIVAGIAAAAIPLARGRGKSEKGSTSGRSKSTGTKSTGNKSTGTKSTKSS
ncbi:MAG TPA: hypothetical protein VF699_04750 [Caulobacteraceae bacterium]